MTSVSTTSHPYRIYQIPLSDNGPQFASWDFSKFSKSYDFVHTTSSSRYPQSIGEAERAVRTIKALLKKADDPLLTLLAYRSTPLKDGYSPAELLMCTCLVLTVTEDACSRSESHRSQTPQLSIKKPVSPGSSPTLTCLFVV